MAAIECKVAMCISRLAEFELLLELKFEQKRGTSLDSLCYKDASSLKTVERLSVPVILGEFRPLIYSELAMKQLTKEEYIYIYIYTCTPMRH
jgi:hypothetical protein